MHLQDPTRYHRPNRPVTGLAGLECPRVPGRHTKCRALGTGPSHDTGGAWSWGTGARARIEMEDPFFGEGMGNDLRKDNDDIVNVDMKEYGTNSNWFSLLVVCTHNAFQATMRLPARPLAAQHGPQNRWCAAGTLRIVIETPFGKSAIVQCFSCSMTELDDESGFCRKPSWVPFDAVFLVAEPSPFNLPNITKRPTDRPTRFA